MTKARELSELGDKITVSGSNVGIGTSSPDALLHLTSGSTTRLLIDNSDTALSEGQLTGAIEFYQNDSSGGGVGTTGKIAMRSAVRPDTGTYFGTTADMSFFVSGATDGNANNNASLEALTIRAGGNVGIGTSAPSDKLHVSGEARFAGSAASAYIRQEGRSISPAYGSLAGLVVNASDRNGNPAWGSIVIKGSDGFQQGSAIYFTTESTTGGEPDWSGGNIPADVRMVLDASGNLLVGTTSTATSSIPGVVISGTNSIYATRANDAPLYLNRLTSDGAIAYFRKDGVNIGSIRNNGNLLQIAGEAVPGFGVFLSNGITNKFGFVDGEDAWRPASDNQFDLGTAFRRYDDVFATNGTIQTSDANEKQDIDVLSDAEQRVAVACKGLLRKFRWKDAVAEKGDAARIHFGIIAQDLKAAFEAEGLDAGNYAMFISSTWWEKERVIPAVEAQEAVYDEEGNLVSEAVEAQPEKTVVDHFETAEEAPEGATERTRLGVRYPELLAFIIAAI